MFSVGDRVISNANDLLAVAGGKQWVGKVECIIDLGGEVVALHTVGFWVKGKPPKAPRFTRRTVASDTVTFLKR